MRGWNFKGLNNSGRHGLFLGQSAEEGGECLETYDKKLRWIQVLRDFNCVVTSTWVGRGKGGVGGAKQIDHTMGARDRGCRTW